MSDIKISVLTSLYNCSIYLNRYFDNIKKLLNLKELEFIFIHNSPTAKEQEIIYKNLEDLNILYQYIEVPLEKLYASWNRGITVAKGKYMAIWNVDDSRFPDSFCLQSVTLDQYPDAALVYGDKYITNSFEVSDLLKVDSIDLYGQNKLLKFQDGVFYMWRKAIHKEIGYFDEQFEVAGDQDFWYRIMYKSKVKKCKSILGVYSDIPATGISKVNKRGATERAIIARRYGFWSPVNLFYYLRLNNKEVRYAKWKNEIHYLQINKERINKYFCYNLIKSMGLTFAYYTLGRYYFKIRKYL